MYDSTFMLVFEPTQRARSGILLAISGLASQYGVSIFKDREEVYGDARRVEITLEAETYDAHWRLDQQFTGLWSTVPGVLTCVRSQKKSNETR